MELDKNKSSRSTQRDMCEEFLKDPTKNPITKRKILRGGKAYFDLLKKCGDYLTFRQKKTKVYLYGSPVFCLFYYNKKQQEYIAKEVTDFRPDPRNYLKSEKVYRAVLNTYSINDTCIIHSITVMKKRKDYEFLLIE